MFTIDIRFDGSLFTDSEGEALSILLLASEDVLQLDWFSDALSPSEFLPDDYVWWFVSAGRNPIQSQDVSGDITGRFSTNRDDDSITGGTITVAPNSTDEGDETAQLIISNTETGARHTLDVVIVGADSGDRSPYNSRWTGTDAADQFTLGQTTQDVEIAGRGGDDIIIITPDFQQTAYIEEIIGADKLIFMAGTTIKNAAPVVDESDGYTVLYVNRSEAGEWAEIRIAPIDSPAEGEAPVNSLSAVIGSTTYDDYLKYFEDARADTAVSLVAGDPAEAPAPLEAATPARDTIIGGGTFDDTLYLGSNQPVRTGGTAGDDLFIIGFSQSADVEVIDFYGDNVIQFELGQEITGIRGAHNQMYVQLEGGATVTIYAAGHDGYGYQLGQLPVLDYDYFRQVVDPVLYTDGTLPINQVMMDGFLFGTEGDDAIAGHTINPNWFFGFEGDDLFFAMKDGDKFYGGDGTDTVNFSAATDVFQGSELIVKGVRNANLNGSMAEGGAFMIQFVDIENLIGNQYANKFHGNEADNYLYGGDGADELYGEGGNDILDGGGDD